MYARNSLTLSMYQSTVAPTTEANSSQGQSAMLVRNLLQEFIASKEFGGQQDQGNIHRRHRYLSPRTLRSYRQYARALNGFFRDQILEQITAAALESYQLHRASTAGPNLTEQELGLLRMAMQKQNLWTPELDAYSRLAHEGSEIPRALTPEQQIEFLRVARSSDRFLLVYCYAVIVLNTCASSYEMRQLRICDVTRGDGLIYVRWGKNLGRERSIALLEDGRQALAELLQRAKYLGASKPNHHLFPFKENPEKQVSDTGLYKPWRELTEAAQCGWFQMNALRHTALTRYAEAGMPIAELMDLAGHYTPKMTRHYIQVSKSATLRHQKLAQELVHMQELILTHKTTLAAAPKKPPQQEGDYPSWATAL